MNDLPAAPMAPRRSALAKELLDRYSQDELAGADRTARSRDRPGQGHRDKGRSHRTCRRRPVQAATELAAVWFAALIMSVQGLPI